MKQKIYLIALLRRTAVLLACGLPALASAAPAAPSRSLPRIAAADVPVSGRVTGLDGAGLPGVTVLVKGSSIGASTNADGAFSLNVPEGSTLVFSFVGYHDAGRAVITAANSSRPNVISMASRCPEAERNCGGGLRHAGAAKRDGRRGVGFGP